MENSIVPFLHFSIIPISIFSGPHFPHPFTSTVYGDATYLTVARKTGSKFVSADRDLIRKMGKLVDHTQIGEL